MVLRGREAAALGCPAIAEQLAGPRPRLALAVDISVKGGERDAEHRRDIARGIVSVGHHRHRGLELGARCSE